MVGGEAGPTTEQIKGHGAWGSASVCARGSVCVWVLAQTELRTVCESQCVDKIKFFKIRIDCLYRVWASFLFLC